ncbi:MAG: helix-turn-helix domain-containing protein [Kineosporiaceae bacterium]
MSDQQEHSGQAQEDEACGDPSCPVARAVAVLDGKWTLLVVRDLLAGPARFGQLRASLRGISPKTLTDRLRELEEAGLVLRTHYPEIPPRVVYELTEHGRSLAPVVAALAAFGRGLPAA